MDAWLTLLNQCTTEPDEKATVDALLAYIRDAKRWAAEGLAAVQLMKGMTAVPRRTPRKRLTSD